MPHKSHTVDRLIKEKRELLDALARTEIEHLRHRKVVIVDDSEESIMLMSNFLKDGAADYQLKTFTNEFQVLEEIGRQTPDLIIMDLMMKNINGDKLALTIKNLNFFNGPILFVSSDTKYQKELENLFGKAVNFMSKPIDKKLFVNKIAKMLG